VRCYASVVLAVIVCPSVCLSIGTVPKRLNTGSCKQRHMITQRLLWCHRSPRNCNGIIANGGHKQRWGRFKSAIFGQYLHLRNGAR